MIKARIRWCTCRVENILTLGKLLSLWFCFLLHSILFLISQTSYRTYKIISRYELARPVMGTIFLVIGTGVTGRILPHNTDFEHSRVWPTYFRLRFLDHDRHTYTYRPTYHAKSRLNTLVWGSLSSPNNIYIIYPRFSIEQT